MARDSILTEHLKVGFIRRFVKPSASILDVGCGPRAIVPAVLGTFPGRTPAEYVGVDEKASGPDYTWAEYRRKPVASIGDMDGRQFQLIVLHSVFRVAPTRAKRRALLRYLKERLADAGTLFIGARTDEAIGELEGDLAKADFQVVDTRGIESKPELVKADGTAEDKRLAKALMEFHDPSFAASLVATVNPEVATKVILVVRHVGDRDVEKRPVRRNSPARRATTTKEKLDGKGGRPSEPKSTVPEGGRAGARRRRARGADVDGGATRARGRADGAGGTAAARPDRRATKPVRRGAAGRGEAQVEVDGIRFGTSGELIRHCLRKGGRSDAEILELNKAAFPWSKAKQSDVNWNRRKLTDGA